MKKLSRKEFLVPALGVVIIFAFVWLGSAANYQNAGVASAPSFQYGASQSDYSNLLGGQRVTETSQGIVGEINTASEFQNVTIQIQALSDNLGGYVQQEILNYNNNAWNGNWLLNFPTDNATIAMLNLRSLISENGQVTSVQIQVNDITNQTSGNKSLVQWSPLSLALQQSTQSANSPLSGALVLLGTIGLDAGYFVAVAVPLYFGILAAVFVSRRGFAPLLLWVGRISKTKVQEEKRVNA